MLESVEKFGVESGPENSEFERCGNIGMVPKRLEFVEELGGEAEAFVEIGVRFARVRDFGAEVGSCVGDGNRGAVEECEGLREQPIPR